MTLVAVTKGVPVGRIRDAVALGLTELGENRVQEAQAKQKALGALRIADCGLRTDVSLQSEIRNSQSEICPIRWHLIGHLQRNKARHAAEGFDCIHSADSLELIDALERASGDRDVPLDVLVQVNISGEASKFGCRPEDAASLVQAAARAPHLRLAGFMTIAPFGVDPELARPHFRRLRQLRDEVVLALNLEPRTLSLSMGMSQDFEVAIEEGADFVRVGTAIFGARAP